MAATINTEVDQTRQSTALRAHQLYTAHQQEVFQRTDKMFAALMLLQWLGGILAALLIAPNTWIGQTSQVSLHVWTAIFLGGAISFLPIALALWRPGRAVTRYSIAVGQMLMSSLLIHLTGGRIETHFHVFGSLAFLSFYRDWRILIPASLVVAVDHLVRGVFYPQSVFGILTTDYWRWLEHAAWIAFTDFFLIISCLRSQREMQEMAWRTAQLDASEERYRSFMENADDIIYRADIEGKFTFVNKAAVQSMKEPAEDLIGRHFSDLVSPEDRKRVQLFYREQFVNSTPRTYFEFNAMAKDGTQFCVGQNVQLILENNEIVGFQAIARDITARVKTERSLKESEERYRIVTDSASDAIMTIDETNTILFANRAAEKIFGYEVNELVGIKLSRLMPNHSQEANQSVVPNVDELTSQNIDGQTVELAAQHKDGHEFPIEISLGKYNAEGKRLFTAVVRDITERKRVAEAIKKSEEYRNLFKHANDAIVIFAPEGELVLDVNDRACEMYGFSRQQFIGRSLLSISKNPEVQEKHLAKLLSGDFFGEFETTQFRKDGTPLDLLINASAIEFEGQTAVLSINRDITARKKSDAALRESEYRFRTLLEGMSEGLLHVDLNDYVQYANDNFCEMVGYSQDELVGKIWTELLLDSEGRALIKLVNDRRRKGVADRYEIKMQKKTGETIWTFVGGAPVYNADSVIVGSMGVFTDITERKRAEEQLLHNALHDALTGLPNRALFLEHLRRTIDRNTRRSATSFAVLFLDFDRFKVINDSLGHMEGDKLLVMIARRLEALLRTSDIIARLGGDEFTILLDELEDLNSVMHVVERIQQDLKFPFNLGGREIFISASIGVAISDSSYTKPEEILRDADIAMYHAKASGRARFQVFSQTMHDQANVRLQLETELRQAVERNEFCLYYQPIVELSNNRLIGFESLLRWQHPANGIVLPLEFIPTMEETGLMIPVGEWALRESCRQLRKWQSQSAANASLTMSINLSCKQFMKSDLAVQLDKILRETELDPGCLRLEITESHVMEDSQMAIAIMRELRALGVKLSIDDFGTGYSSLSYLHRLPIDYLKIDRSFVSRMQINRENEEIVRTILLLAKNLEIEVVAEGIETIEQAAHLRKLQCKFGQGYFFSKPKSVEEASEYMMTRAFSELTIKK